MILYGAWPDMWADLLHWAPASDPVKNPFLSSDSAWISLQILPAVTLTHLDLLATRTEPVLTRGNRGDATAPQAVQDGAW